MKSEKKHQENTETQQEIHIDFQKNEELIDHYVEIATSVNPPPLYDILEIEGIAVKQYSFIRGQLSLFNNNHAFFQKKIQQEDITILSAYKNELENQLELNQKSCIGAYIGIKAITGSWLRKKLNTDLNFKDQKCAERKLTNFAHLIRNVLQWIMIGVGFEETNKKLWYAPWEPIVELKNSFDERIVFNLNEFMTDLHSPYLERIYRVVSKSVEIYLDYVNVNSRIYNMDSDKVLCILKENSDKLEDDRKPGRPPKYDKSIAIEYFSENHLRLTREYFKNKTKVAEEIQANAYPLSDAPNSQTIVGYIEVYLNR